MKINLLCSDRNIPKNLFQHHNQEAWAGIDRGALILIQNQIDPVFSVGDFDSVNNQERQLLATQLNIHPVKAEKDDTDLGLGVAQAVEEGYQDIHI
ncbi:MAG: thiamine diphosphokinase, partial [Staphylococcus sp.]|nr:thiamine diphosphokinase [Staphylococcus sp.]